MQPNFNQTNKMKKILTLLTAVGFTGLVACGPSAEEQKAMEDALKKAADSAANALLQQASESATQPTTDSTATAPATSPAHGEEGHVCDANCTAGK